MENHYRYANVAEKGLDLRVYAEPPIGKKLLGDPVRLYQALMNLLSNAVKFTNAGAVEFSSAIKCSDGDSMTIYFEVKDEGIGSDRRWHWNVERAAGETLCSF